MNQPARLADHVVHLTDALGIGIAPLADELWRERERPELATGRLVSLFEYDVDVGLSGAAPHRRRARLRDRRRRRPSRRHAAPARRAVHVPAGFAGIVPAGGWHRLAVREPCSGPVRHADAGANRASQV